MYGTEGPLYYLRNGFNNFNGCFILALLFLGILPITRKKYSPDLVVVVSPIYIWIAFMSLQPHKEERLGNYTTFYSIVSLQTSISFLSLRYVARLKLVSLLFVLIYFVLILQKRKIDLFISNEEVISGRFVFHYFHHIQLLCSL